MTELPQKLDLRSHDIADDKRQVLLRLFPEIRTEAGELDFDRLKLVLGESVDVGKERYGMNWPGKAECIKAIQTPSLGTLLPLREDSINFDGTSNLFIEGDNLEVLKILQKSQLGSVRMIYIDPPYNTGNDFIYPDNYTESLQTYLEYTGQVDSEGKRFSTNTESNGRFHSNWLNMLYPRLYLAKNVLREDGVIFISIDDNESSNLRKVCDEVLGEENFIATLVWEKGRKNDAKRFSVGHEYLICYAKNLSVIEEQFPAWREPKAGVTEIVEEYKRLKSIHRDDFGAISTGLASFYQSLPENHPSKKYSRSRFVDERGIWRDNNISWPGGGGPKYDLFHPKTNKPCKVPDDGWRFVEETMKAKIRDGYVEFREDHTKSPFLKSYLYVDSARAASEEDPLGEKMQVMGSVFYRHSQPSTDVLKELFGEKIFENPKDHGIIARLIKYCTDRGDTVLDFFAGSGTTAHSVLELNNQDGGSRKFILIQLPEPLDPNDKDQKVAVDFCDRLAKPRNIAEITKERIRRVIKDLNLYDADKLKLEQEGKQDRGFRAFKLAESNFKPWNAAIPLESAALERQLELHIHHVREDRTEQDLLYEILLKSGYPLITPVESVTILGKTVHSVAGGQLLICLERKLTLELIRAIAERKPERVVCLDEGFAGNDQLKTNAAHIFEPTDRREAKSEARRFRTV